MIVREIGKSVTDRLLGLFDMSCNEWYHDNGYQSGEQYVAVEV